MAIVAVVASSCCRCCSGWLLLLPKSCPVLRSLFGGASGTEITVGKQEEATPRPTVPCLDTSGSQERADPKSCPVFRSLFGGASGTEITVGKQEEAAPRPTVPCLDTSGSQARADPKSCPVFRSLFGGSSGAGITAGKQEEATPGPTAPCLDTAGSQEAADSKSCSVCCSSAQTCCMSGLPRMRLLHLECGPCFQDISAQSTSFSPCVRPKMEKGSPIGSQRPTCLHKSA
jgi:hypothetical protein